MWGASKAHIGSSKSGIGWPVAVHGTETGRSVSEAGPLPQLKPFDLLSIQVIIEIVRKIRSGLKLPSSSEKH